MELVNRGNDTTNGGKIMWCLRNEDGANLV